MPERAPRRAAGAVPPDSFSVVMATGIVSVAAYGVGYPYISYVLAGLAGGVFVVLLGLVPAGLLRNRRALVGTLRDPSQVFGLFTFVAACDILNKRLDQRPLGLALALGLAALAAWLVLVPLAGVALRSRPLRSLRNRVRGSWMLAAVGTQSLGLTAAGLSSALASRPLLVLSLAWWALGVAVYVAVAALALWRVAAWRPGPGEVTPDSWVFMGALAIATLAGGELLLAAEHPEAFAWLGTLMEPATVAVWAVASAWIPALVAGEVWRARRVPGTLRYVRTRWSTVFPLGMYASATSALAVHWGGAPGLQVLSRVVFWVALVTWCLTAAGLLHEASRHLRAA